MEYFFKEAPLDDTWNEIFDKRGINLNLLSKITQKISDAIGYTGKIVWDTNMPDGTPRKKLDISK